MQACVHAGAQHMQSCTLKFHCAKSKRHVLTGNRAHSQNVGRANYITQWLTMTLQITIWCLIQYSLTSLYRTDVSRNGHETLIRWATVCFDSSWREQLSALNTENIFTATGMWSPLAMHGSFWNLSQRTLLEGVSITLSTSSKPTAQSTKLKH